MSQDELLARLLQDISSINLPIDEVNVQLRPYSKTFYGRYFPSNNPNVTPKIYVYPYSNEIGDMIPYDKILETLIHEFIHHIQYTSGCFVRTKGVMHNANFWQLYNFYINRAKKVQLFGGELIEN